MTFSIKTAAAILAFCSLASAAPIEGDAAVAQSHNITVVNNFKHNIAVVLNETQPEFSNAIKKCGINGGCIHKVVDEEVEKIDRLGITATVEGMGVQTPQDLAAAVEQFKVEYADVIEEIHERGAKMGHDCGRKPSTPGCIKAIPKKLAAELEAESKSESESVTLFAKYMSAKARLKEMLKGKANVE